MEPNAAEESIGEEESPPTSDGATTTLNGTATPNQPTAMSAIEDIYAEVDADIEEEEFREAVEAKVEEMGGLVDEEVAAMLIAEDLGESEVEGIADIEPGMEEVQFLGKVVSVGEMRTFERDDEEAEEGRVVNVEVADETGHVRLAMWDQDAAAAVEELEPAQVLRIQGRPKDGYSGLEVSADRVEVDEEAELDVDLEGSVTIDSLAMGQSDVTVDGVVLDTEPVRTFDRDDGSEGQVRNVRLQDDTGDIRVALWGDKADLDIGPGDEVLAADVEIQDGWQDDLEASAGWQSTVTQFESGLATAAGDVATDRTGTGESGSDDAETGLDAFADDGGDGTAATGDTDDVGDAAASGPVEFTGTVVQTGDPVKLDDGEETVKLRGDADVTLGENVTVRGTRDGEFIDVEEVF